MSTILVDTNALSNAKLAARIGGKDVYFCDTVLLELFANGEWERSITTCLAPLAPFASHVRVSPNLGALLNHELATGEPTTSIEGDPDVQSRIKSLLLGCINEPHRMIEYFRVNQPLAVEERAWRLARMDADKGTSLAIIEVVRNRSKDEVLRRLRNRPEEISQELTTFKDEISSSTRSLAFGLGCKNPDRLSSGPSCWMRLLLADICLAVRRTQQPSFERLNGDKLHAEHSDREVVILGTYCDELFTCDKGANWLNTAMRALLRDWF